VKSQDAQHAYIAGALTRAVKNCEKNGVSPEIIAQTFLSVSITLLLSYTSADDAARMLEGIVATIRSGQFTGDDA